MSYFNNNKISKNIKPFSAKNVKIKPEQLTLKTINNNLNKNKKKLAQFILGKKLGHGAFATVRLAKHIKTNKIVAIKILEKEKLKEIDKIRLNREIKILKKVRHPNIVNLYNVINAKKEIYIIMEYVQGIELISYINERKKLSEKEACYFYQQIISGLEYLEKLKIVHRDIKPENIIIEYNKNIKIIDFGLSNIYPEENILFSSCGSPCYAPPEMILGQKYSGSGVDIWSSGIVLFAMLCGYLPFTETDEQRLYKKITEGKLYFPYYLSDLSKDLLRKILNKNPSKRINFNKIKQHPWFNLNNPKFTFCPGFLIDKIITPIDLDVIDIMVKDYKYNEIEIKIDLLKNKHNNLTTIYYILLDEKIKKGEKSLADMKSEEYFNYINDPSNLLSNYNYDIDKVISEIIFKNKNELKYFYRLEIKRKAKSYNNSPRKIIFENNQNLNIKNKLKLDIDNTEEYLMVESENKEINNRPIENNINVKKNFIKEIKKRNLSQKSKIDKTDKLLTNTTYFKRPKRNNYSINNKTIDGKKIKKYLYVNIINDNNSNKDNNLTKDIKNSENLTMNNNNYRHYNNSYSKIKRNINYNNSAIIYKNIEIKNKSRNKEKEISKKKNDKIKVNNINNGKKNIMKKLINKKTEPFNSSFKFKNNLEINSFMDGFQMKKKISKTNIKILDKGSINEIRKNQNYKSHIKENYNKENIMEIKKENYESNKKDSNINSFKNDNKASINSKFHSKKLYVKLKKSNNNYLSLEKKKLNKSKNSDSGTNIKTNIINYTNLSKNNNDSKENNIIFNEQDNYYKKLKTIDIKIKNLRKSKTKVKQNQSSISKNFSSKKFSKNKNGKDRSESVKERLKIIEITEKYNKRLNTEYNSIKTDFNKNNKYKTIKVYKKRNLYITDDNTLNNNNTNMKSLITNGNINSKNNSLKKKRSSKENNYSIKKSNKKENKNNTSNKKNNNKENDIKKYLPFDLNCIFKVKDLNDVYEMINKYLKENKIKFIQQKNKYSCMSKYNTFDFYIENYNGFISLYLLKVIIKNSSNNLIKEISNEIINNISKL